MGNAKMEFKHVEKWKNNLNGCIRCGYCFQHCPVSKHTGWESDTPRAKLITIFGMLTGHLEPSQAIANKLFSCFYCKRCVAACSSGVPLTDIFTDAKADFVEAGYEVPGTTSCTDSSCALCLMCIDVCPHGARSYSVEKNKIVTDMVKCQSCGRCVITCPAEAAKIKTEYGTGFTDLKKDLGEFFNKDKNPDSKAAIFLCNWSNYSGMQASTIDPAEDESAEYKVLVNMCGGRLGISTLLEPFLNNAWGIMVSCCPEGECEHDGNIKAKKDIESLKKVFQEMDINPDRLYLVEIAHGNPDTFQMEVDKFMEKINKLGPITR